MGVDLEKIAGHYTTKPISCKEQKSSLQIHPSKSGSMLRNGQKESVDTPPIINNSEIHNEDFIERFDKFNKENKEISEKEEKYLFFNHKILLSSKALKETRTTIDLANEKSDNNFQHRQVPEFVESVNEQECLKPQQQKSFTFHNNNSPLPRPGIPPKQNKSFIPATSSYLQNRNPFDQKERYSSLVNEKSNPWPIFTKKWAMVSPETRSECDKHLSITNIKRYILFNWALKPPEYNILRPIDWLVSSIHDIFPPSFGVTSHEYFKNWKPIKHEDLTLGASMTGIDEEKLKKTVKKLRFFLHP